LSAAGEDAKEKSRIWGLLKEFETSRATNEIRIARTILENRFLIFVSTNIWYISFLHFYDMRKGEEEKIILFSQ